ncbi:MAG: O-antigen ligase family protein [Bacteroidaceae bacterium]|nr:O-antigen ligase family protein [Bacteroidaceae bacterium]
MDNIKQAIRDIKIPPLTEGWGMSLLFILPFVFITLQPVEQGWSRADILLARTIPIVGTAGAAIALWRRGFLCLSPTDCLIGLWLPALLLRVWMDDGYPCSTFVLRTLLMAALYIALRLVFTACPADGKTVAAAVILLATWEAAIGLWQCVAGGSRHHLYLMTGTFQNPGPFSLLPAMGVVMCAQWMTTATPRLRQWLWLPLLLCAVVLPATWSRAAWVAAAAVLALVCCRKWWRWRWGVAAMAVAAATALYLVKRGSADGRLLIWRICLRGIAQHPWLGSGTGSFFHRYAEETAAMAGSGTLVDWTSADVPGYAFNELLRIGVEQGVPGMAMALVLAGMVTWRLWHSCRPLAVGMMTMLVFSMFSYPFALLPYQIIFVMMTAWAGTKQPVADAGSDTVPSPDGQSPVGSGAIGDRRKVGQGGSGSSVLLLSVLLLLLSLPVHNAIQEHRQAERSYCRMAGLRHAAFTADYYTLLPLMEDQPRFLFDFGKLLAEQGRWNDSNDMLRRGTRVSADPMFHVLMGNNYRAMGAWQEAETMYRKAFRILPNRLYPLYRLMLLYEETGETEKMRDMAEKILMFRPKVESKATREMKEKARLLMENGE